VVFADIGTSVYYAPGILFGRVGSRTALFIGMTLVVFVLLAIKYAEVAIRYPGGGGVVTVASRAINPFAGLIGGLLILVDYFLTAALSALSGLIYLTVVAGSLRPWVLPATVAALLLLGFINLMGVKASAEVTAVIAVLAVASQLLVVMAVAVHLGPSGILASFPKALNGPSIGPVGILTGYASAFLAFSGLESIAQLSPSMAEPRQRTAPIAMSLVVITIALTSPLLSLWSTTLLDTRTADPNQFVSILGGYAAGPLLQAAIAISGSLLLIFASNTALIGTYHVFLALSKLRFLPGVLTQTNRWRGTPHWSILAATAVPVAILVASGGSVGILGDLYAFGLLGAFSMTCLALDIVRWHERPNPVSFAVGVLTTVLVLVAWVTNLFAKPTATLFGGGLTLVGLAIATATYQLARRRGQAILFPDIHRAGRPLLLVRLGRRLRPAVLVLLPHDPDQAESIAQTAVEIAGNRSIAFLYVAHEDEAPRRPPRLLEIVTPYQDDLKAQQAFARAERAATVRGNVRGYVYVPGIAPPGMLEEVIEKLQPAEAILFDDGTGVIGEDRAQLKRIETHGGRLLHLRRS
jgi:amino acid transporter